MLVIGLVGYALVALGGFAIVLFAVLTALGVFLCFCLAEMAATWPERAGGLPVVRVRDVQAARERPSRALGGLSSWALLARLVHGRADQRVPRRVLHRGLFNIDFGGSFGPIHDEVRVAIPVDVFVVAMLFLLVMFIPCWLGIRLGATFATVLGIGSIIPLVLPDRPPVLQAEHDRLRQPRRLRSLPRDEHGLRL